MNPLQALVENLRQPKADYCLRCRRACAAALAAALVAGGTLRESIDSLMAFGEGEQEGRRKAGDREQYQFYGGWVAALQRVLALLAVERGTAAEKVPYFEVSHHELERDLLRASAFWWECYRQFQHEIPSHRGFLGENVVIMWRSDFETLQAATDPLPPAEAVAGPQETDIAICPHCVRGIAIGRPERVHCQFCEGTGKRAGGCEPLGLHCDHASPLPAKETPK